MAANCCDAHPEDTTRLEAYLDPCRGLTVFVDDLYDQSLRRTSRYGVGYVRACGDLQRGSVHLRCCRIAAGADAQRYDHHSQGGGARDEREVPFGDSTG